jgi:hypothetical protein
MYMTCKIEYLMIPTEAVLFLLVQLLLFFKSPRKVSSMLYSPVNMGKPRVLSCKLCIVPVLLLHDAAWPTQLVAVGLLPPSRPSYPLSWHVRIEAAVVTPTLGHVSHLAEAQGQQLHLNGRLGLPEHDLTQLASE